MTFRFCALYRFSSRHGLSVLIRIVYCIAVSQVRLAMLLGCLAALTAVFGLPLRADEATARYFRGLRERRLFNLAESYCAHRLSRPDCPPDQRADLTLELAET